jgi:hypothetical protein
MLSCNFSPEKRPYTGKELRPHFILSELGIKGSGIGAFLGPCRVETENLVDWEDRLALDRIEARMMVHFIGEFFGATLKEGVLLQRLFMASALESLNQKLESLGRTERLTRSGDDLFLGQNKLSVSIVTASVVSQLLHVGINVNPEGAPVAAVGLGQLGMSDASIEQWAREFLQAFSEEWAGMEWACVKVRPVM